jgi:hypothetical protein
MFVDQFDQEHSRDIEPMKGGHGDNYFYQLASQVRRYKGARPPTRVRPGAIQLDGRFEDWAAVEPEFRDTVGDPVHRHHRGWDARVTYTNDSGRNDIVSARVSFDEQRVYFHARTREALAAPVGTNWMLLLLDLDASTRTGWLGYDFVLNRAAPGSVERHAGSGFAWRNAGTAEWRLTDNGLELSLPWSALGLPAPPDQFDFSGRTTALPSATGRTSRSTARLRRMIGSTTVPFCANSPTSRTSGN